MEGGGSKEGIEGIFGRPPVGSEGSGGTENSGMSATVRSPENDGSGGKLGFGNDGIVGSFGIDSKRWRAASHFSVLLVKNMTITARTTMQLL